MIPSCCAWSTLLNDLAEVLAAAGEHPRVVAGRGSDATRSGGAPALRRLIEGSQLLASMAHCAAEQAERVGIREAVDRFMSAIEEIGVGVPRNNGQVQASARRGVP